MKRGGKGEEKLMGPLFPRLHVNDTEKGGPRAPPRNKMALYEQLSIPSQRFKHGISNNPKSANYQGPGRERDVSFSAQLPPSRHPAEKPHSCSSNSKTPLLPVDSNKKAEEDDFRVPVFVKSKLAVSRERSCNFTSIPSMDKLDDVLKEADVRLQYEPRDDPGNTSGIFCKAGLLQPECSVDSQVGGTILAEPVMIVDHGDSSLLVKDVSSKEQGDDLSETSMVESISGMYISPDDVVGLIGQKHFWSARKAIANQQRAFAVQVFELHRLIKVQRLIAGSQSVLDDGAYLVKSVKDSSTKTLPLEHIFRDGHNVSKRKDSEKPNTRIECTAENTVDKPVKDSSAKRLPLEYIIRDGNNVLKQRKDSEKPNVSMECSAENTVVKAASFSSVQNNSQPSSYRPFSGHPITNDSTMGPWSFNQPSGHQWLIPVMTPSEGLVYKPYPGPGVTSSVYGGSGTAGLTSSYGIPASYHLYQGVEMPFAPPASHAYFPPYGMPVINPAISSSLVDQSNQFVAQNLQSQLLEGGANFYVQRQNSSNVPNSNHETVPDVKSHSSRDVEMQASTASSPSGTTIRKVVDNATERRSVLPLFPTSPPETPDTPVTGPQPCVPVNPARVIKVVPRNARSATESAARIFQSIQEERKQYDSGFTHL
ncbi:protein EARLY FLOWERING 3 isoform X4 [Capsicum annuum]|uniref:protein EARLY FLOWERING 3 isoform X4 n=1 Tax=Capsicum annuum TaxID=4072 RepID=UPI001FB114B3|nr:protein EARLY FLOWERING 3 isoform X4 [Capsicum annuum]XP_047257186.1 protein EARLY FLOWERING 3 isoform X4 [Capsicum annuum]